jgi:glutamate-1-semialdehyde 2,1-aminomutase
MSRLNEMFESAQKFLVGGATAGGRYHAVLGQPIYMQRAQGSKLYDVEGKEYIDFHTSAGAAIFGYNHPRLKEAAQKAIDLGFFMNFETEYHRELAELLTKMIPCAERVRLSNSGTEVTMAAIRLARGYTKRDLIIRFEGHFHGMHELIWYNHNGEGLMAPDGEISNIPDTAGMPQCFSDVIKNVEFNDIEALERIVSHYKDQVAAVIMEPISYNCGCYPARKEYLEKVRALCDKEGIVLIFDEVITGLRLRPGSAQAYYNVIPDIATFAKAIGGGFPVAALVGKEKIMNTLNPIGPVVMSGTYTGSLMPVLVSLECLKMAQEPYYFDHLEELSSLLYTGMNDLMQKNAIRGHVRGMGARFGIYFGVENPEDDYNWRKTKQSFDPMINRKFLAKCLEYGLYFHDYGMSPVPAHNGFGLSHSVEDVNITLERIEKIFQEIR